MPEAILKAQERAITLIKEEKLNQKRAAKYKCPVEQSLKLFETKGKEILTSMIVTYGIKPGEMKELLSDDVHLKRQQEVKEKVKDQKIFSDLMKTLDDVIQRMMDQYEGLRQIGDFRGIPDFGAKLVRDGGTINAMFKKMMISAQVILIEDLLRKGKGVPKNYHKNFEKASLDLLDQFYLFKTGVLSETGLVSSLRERDGNFNFNCSHAKQFMQEIFDATEKHLVKVRKDINDKIKEIQQLPEDVQAQIYRKFYGVVQFDMDVENQFALIQPWVEKWIEVQVASILQREIYSPSRESLEVTRR